MSFPRILITSEFQSQVTANQNTEGLEKVGEKGQLKFYLQGEVNCLELLSTEKKKIIKGEKTSYVKLNIS